MLHLKAIVKYLFPVLIITLLVFGITAFSSQKQLRPSVLGEQSGTNSKIETPETPETPEQENETEKVDKEVEAKINDESVTKVEVHPNSPATPSGKVVLEKTDGSKNEITISSSSSASLISVQSDQAGTVSVSVSRNGTVTLVNAGITVQTNYPVIIDPKTQSVAIKTPSGVTVINTLPSQALNNLSAVNKPSIVQSAVLGMQDGQPYYDIKGVQQIKFLGIIPISANIETKVNATDGATISSDKPWYLSNFGFLYSI